MHLLFCKISYKIILRFIVFTGDDVRGFQCVFKHDILAFLSNKYISLHTYSVILHFLNAASVYTLNKSSHTLKPRLKQQIPAMFAGVLQSLCIQK